MRNVVRDVRENLLQRHRAIVAVDAAALKRFGRQRAQDPRHVCPAGFDDGEFFFDLAIVIREFAGKQIRIAAEERWFMLRDDPLHAVDIHGLEIGQVSDQFERAPFAGDGASEELLACQAGDCLAQLRGAGGVLID